MVKIANLYFINSQQLYVFSFLCFYKCQKINSDMSYKKHYNSNKTYFLRTPKPSNKIQKGYLFLEIAFFGILLYEFCLYILGVSIERNCDLSYNISVCLSSRIF